MAAPENLAELYAEELKDLWSANTMMQKTVEQMAEAAEDDRLKDRLRDSAAQIASHTQILRQLLEQAGEDAAPEHCKGMEGLTKEARKHALDEEFDEPALRDVALIAQYQRMAHYGISGFGTAAALADALGRKDQASRLRDIVKDKYGSDQYLTDLAERAVNVEAARAA
jgi:ferritin-like metal-binding protein YciE